jgi:hypothetical protein
MAGNIMTFLCVPQMVRFLVEYDIEPEKTYKWRLEQRLQYTRVAAPKKTSKSDKLGGPRVTLRCAISNFWSSAHLLPYLFHFYGTVLTALWTRTDSYAS